ncbi:hypothetical protein RRG08_061542 [Elysia crispata]|uniref:Uncharacterized protein n=1 Tax=Elysia crispata TaxID=231223 RepID=A0AAE1APV2_9GAST|nr:hypothetical protein RRG08_061542 [Elysia crispata]
MPSVLNILKNTQHNIAVSPEFGLTRLSSLGVNHRLPHHAQCPKHIKKYSTQYRGITRVWPDSPELAGSESQTATSCPVS